VQSCSVIGKVYACGVRMSSCRGELVQSFVEVRRDNIEGGDGGEKSRYRRWVGALDEIAVVGVAGVVLFVRTLIR